MDRVTHTFKPVYNEESRILILGTFPSVKSREGMFYYHHPQNRFWRVAASLLGVPVPESVSEKKEMLLKGKIAVWDVIHSCTIAGSSDSSIRAVTVNDIESVLEHSDIRQIYGNGDKAYQLYRKYLGHITGKEMIRLPSTSPANAAWSLDKLTQAWSICRKWL